MSDVPGKITVADLMYVEGNRGVQKPLLLHTDVCTKFVTGVVMSGKDKTDCIDAIIAVKDDCKIKGQRMEEYMFDCEPAIVPLESTLKEHEIELKLKAAGQKVKLAEVNIRNIRIKAWNTKAGVREIYKVSFSKSISFACVP